MSPSQRRTQTPGVMTRSMARRQRDHGPDILADRGNIFENNESPRTVQPRGARKLAPYKGKKGSKNKQISKAKNEGNLKSPGMKESESKCCICLEVPSTLEKAQVNGCSHLFCFCCIEKWAEQENSCPLCKSRFTEIDRRVKRNGGMCAKKSTKKVNRCNQRSHHSGENPVILVGRVSLEGWISGGGSLYRSIQSGAGRTPRIIRRIDRDVVRYNYEATIPSTPSPTRRPGSQSNPGYTPPFLGGIMPDGRTPHTNGRFAGVLLQDHEPTPPSIPSPARRRNTRSSARNIAAAAPRPNT